MNRNPSQGSNRQRTRRVVLVLAVVFLSLFSLLPNASAHSDDQSYLYLDFGQTLRASLQMPFDDVREVLGIDITGTDDEIDAAISQNESALRDYAEAHFDIGADEAIFDKEYIEVSRFADTNHVQVVFTMRTGAEIPETLSVRLDPFVQEIPERDALLLVSNDWNRGIVDNEGEQLFRFVADTGTQTVTLGESSWWRNFTTSISAGLDHIRTGPDHMLFIFALMLPSVLVWTSAWKPATGFGTSLWRVTKIMTMFTVAHSVTFTLAGVGLVPTPSARITESIIALSIAATAVHNLRPVFKDREWVIAFVFGLFHGFGFASLVQSLDVSTETQLISLAGRNIGIELGQLLVVFIAFPMLFLLRNTNAYLPLFRLACYGLIVASIGWMAERLFDAPDVTSLVIDKALQFPRVLVAIALATAAAFVWQRRERQAGRLIESVSTEDQIEDSTPAKELVG